MEINDKSIVMWEVSWEDDIYSCAKTIGIMSNYVLNRSLHPGSCSLLLKNIDIPID